MALVEPAVDAYLARQAAERRRSVEGASENPWIEGAAPELVQAKRERGEGKRAVMRGPAVLRNRAAAEGDVVRRLERGEEVRLVKVVDGWALLVVEGPRGLLFGWAREEDVLAR
jgi:hypothetical protein